MQSQIFDPTDQSGSLFGGVEVEKVECSYWQIKF